MRNFVSFPVYKKQLLKTKANLIASPSPLEKMLLNEASEQAFRKIYLSGLLLKLFMIMKTSAYEKQRQKTKALSVKNENTVWVPISRASLFSFSEVRIVLAVFHQPWFFGTFASRQKYIIKILDSNFRWNDIVTKGVLGQTLLFGNAIISETPFRIYSPFLVPNSWVYPKFVIPNLFRNLW